MACTELAQAINLYGATERSRTADLLITNQENINIDEPRKTSNYFIFNNLTIITVLN